MAKDFDLVVFSHLRWSFVWQRPQHLLSRLAKQRRVFFIEEPEFAEGATAHWQRTNPQDNLTICTPKTPLPPRGFSDEQMPQLQRLVRDLCSEENIDRPVAWFYTPMALPLLTSTQPRGVVYDCMDELSAFLHAPPQLIDREKELLAAADIVFTGGPSIFKAKQPRHPNVHCFPSSVDRVHFGRAAGSEADHSEQQPIARPRLGFFGVIDERLDLELLKAASDARPEWQFILVGPVVKIDPATLPQAANIHYFGQRSYDELPDFLSGWDVCLLPFARNDATRYISPTKTLEYMAANKPIVSTPITDVAEPYGDIVYLGSTPAEFIAACERALHDPPAERNAREEKMQQVLQRTSWDDTANRMTQLINGIVRDKSTGSSNKSSSETSPSTKPTKEKLHGASNQEFESPGGVQLEQRNEWASQAAENNPPVVVIGAGPTGLSAAYHLQEDALLLEQKSTVGGWCRSIDVNGFTFDFAGHIMFSNDPYVHEMYQTLLGDNVHWQDREAWIYSKETYTRYPFQGSLYGLPPAVITECIVGAIESRYGSISASPDAAPAACPPRQVSMNTQAHGNGNGNGTGNGNGSARGSLAPATKDNGNGNGNGSAAAKGNGHGKTLGNGNGKDRLKGIQDCCADGVLESTAPLAQRQASTAPQAAPANFEEFIYKVWGAGIAKHFAIPYNRKLWAVPLNEMETSWLGGRVPMPDLKEMVEGALSPSPKPMGPNARFGYPLHGGFQSLMNGFLPLLKGPVRLNTRVVGFSPKRHELTLSTGEVIPYEQLISTMPLPVLIRLAGEEAPEDVREAARQLRYISVRCVHIGVGRENLTEKHWIYYPEDTVFHRIFVQGNASPHCNPPGGFGLTCEITYHPDYKPLPCDGDELIQRCIDDCRRVGMFDEKDPIWATAQVDLPHAYVIYDHARKANVARIREWLRTQDVLLAGRYSEWEYYNSDHAFLAGKKAADAVRSLRSSPVAVAAK